MEMNKAEAVAKIKCDIGVDHVLVRPMYGKWVIVHPVSEIQAEVIYSASTREDCMEVYDACVGGNS